MPDIHSRNATVRGNAERNAINTPIQGTAADIIKIAMIRIHRSFKKRQLTSRMVLQVHDELNFDVPSSEESVVTDLVKEIMESAVQLKVPLLAETGIGNNWLEAH